MFPNSNSQFGFPVAPQQQKQQMMDFQLNDAQALVVETPLDVGTWRVKPALDFTQELMQIPIGQLITWYLGDQGRKPLESWLPVVAIQPPWSIQDVVRVIDKHWMSVFREVYPRSFRDGNQGQNKKTDGAGLKRLLELVRQSKHTVAEQVELLNQLEIMLKCALDAKGVDQSQIDVASAWQRIAPQIPVHEAPSLTGRPAWQVRNVFRILKDGFPEETR